MSEDVSYQDILAEIQTANVEESRAYLLGASRDGTFNRLHKTLRISQSSVQWLEILQILFARVGSRSWIYRESGRGVWVIESTCRLVEDALGASPNSMIALCPRILRC